MKKSWLWVKPVHFLPAKPVPSFPFPVSLIAVVMLYFVNHLTGECLQLLFLFTSVCTSVKPFHRFLNALRTPVVSFGTKATEIPVFNVSVCTLLLLQVVISTGLQRKGQNCKKLLLLSEYKGSEYQWPWEMFVLEGFSRSLSCVWFGLDLFSHQSVSGFHIPAPVNQYLKEQLSRCPFLPLFLSISFYFSGLATEIWWKMLSLNHSTDVKLSLGSGLSQVLLLQ